jgi:UDP-2,3-diacylglucosamine pyrophosphatase LpxH
VAAVRTLIISDLHLGQRPGQDLLRRRIVLDRLIDALDGIDRLVLLGDIVELGSRLHRRRPMEVAGPVLAEIAAAIGPEGEIVLVPGNHDGAMIRDWVRTRGTALGLNDSVATDATPLLGAVTAMLAPARVRVSYPGFWVREDVWATHGHYLDRHLIPESTFGLRRRGLADPVGDAVPGDYEQERRRAGRARRARRSRSTVSSLRQRPLATALEHLAELTRHGGDLLRGAHLTRLTAGALDVQARHAAVPALAHVVGRLGVQAPWVIFGHIHRPGPDPDQHWQPWPSAPRLLNTGSWVYEPLLLDHASPPHPYWPGAAVLVTDDDDPQLLGLLDGLSGAELAGRAFATDR